jgi:hypothetical protein
VLLLRPQVLRLLRHHRQAPLRLVRRLPILVNRRRWQRRLLIRWEWEWAEETRLLPLVEERLDSVRRPLININSDRRKV